MAIRRGILAPRSDGSGNSMKTTMLRRYRRIMITAYVLCLAVAGVLLFFQYRAADHLRQLSLEKRVAQHAQNVDLLLARSVAEIDMVRELAQSYLSEHLAPPPPTLYRLEDNADASRFRAVLQRNDIALRYVDTTLSGAGTSIGRSPAFYREIAMALELTRAFYALKQNLPEVAWVYYNSKQGFINLYPARAGNEWFFTPETLDQAFFVNGSPERNPARKVFWTGVYRDLAGLGQMVTCAAPVDENGRFVGTVALDLTLESMTTYLNRQDTGPGTLFLIQLADGALLTRPNTGLVPEPERLIQRMLQQLTAGQARIRFDQRHASGSLLHVEGVRLDSAPWLLVYVENRDVLAAPEARHQLLVFLGLAGLITALLVLAQWLIQREFVLPAANLVEHLRASSQGEMRPFRAPASWLPWFELVRDTFREKHRLVLDLHDHNERLDELVRRRTAEVESANRELKLMLEHLNRARLEMMRSQQELEEKNRHLEELASHDGLTHLVNRGHFDAILINEWRRMQRTGQPLSLLMIDIDRFKAYNDTQGHLKGDEALVAVASAIAATFLRAGDLTARYGGEEFAVLLPGLDLEGAMALAEEARASIQALGIAHPASEHGGVVTASFGVACVRPSQYREPSDLIAEADAALYRAKDAGRNCVRGPE